MQLYLHNDNNVWLTEMKLDEDNTLIEDATLAFSLGSLVEGEYGTITAATHPDSGSRRAWGGFRKPWETALQG